MARCHSCGRETLRTEDWACQWCGYPLMSGAYGKIEKTYRQLKEERLRGVEEEPVTETEIEVIAEVEEVVEPEPEPEQEQPEEIEVKEEVEVAQEVEVPVEEEEEKVREPEPEPETEAEPEAKPEEVTPDEAEAVAEVEPEPEAMAEIETEAETEVEAEEEKESEPEEEPEPELGPADMEINVTEMFEAYQQDDAAADKRFVGKVIKMTGVISMIDIKNVSDMHCIRLTGSEEDLMQSVKCMFGKQHAQSLMRLEKGQTVTAQGKYDGSIIAMRMVDCVLVE